MKLRLAIGSAAILAAALLMLWPREPERQRHARPTVRHLDDAATSDTAAGPLAAPQDEWKPDRWLDVHGVVTDECARAVGGARVAATILGPEGEGGTVVGSCVTDGSGRFAIRLNKGQHVLIAAQAVGFLPYRLRSVQAGERVTIVLRAPTQSQVCVVDVAQRPIVAARIALTAVGSDGAAYSVAGTSGNDGCCLLDVPGRLTATVIACADGFAPSWTSFQTSTHAAALVTLQEAMVVSGVVTDATTDEPLSDVAVGMDGPAYPSVRTTRDGLYCIRCCPRERGTAMGGTRELLFSRAGYATARLRVSDGVLGNVALRRLETMTGRVVTALGEPVVGAAVTLRSFATDGRGRIHDASCVHSVSDDRGRFAMAGALVGLTHVLGVQANGCGREARVVVPTEVPCDAGDICMRAANTIVGQLESEQMLPVARLPITLKGWSEDGHAKAGGECPAYIGGIVVRCCSDDVGRFVLCEMAAGDYELRVEMPDGGTVRDRVVIEGSGKDIQLHMILPAAGAGQVVWAKSAPEHGRCTVVDADQNHVLLECSVDGGRPMVGDEVVILRGGAVIGRVVVLSIDGRVVAGKLETGSAGAGDLAVVR